ncbi:archease, partial [Candidatus Woesearchaeota archaeon]|nr:archease [Candidatus Woesearchaeota archaeon]
MPYKFIEDVSMADVAIEIKAKTLEKLLEDAALGTTNVMVRNLKAVRHKVRKKIVIRQPDAEKLFYHFLQEILFLKDANMLLFSKFSAKVSETKKGYVLKCTASGEKLD